MKIPLNRILETIPPSGIRKFFEIVAERKDVISLSVGEPDFDAPWRVREAAIAALESGETHYTPNKGYFELRTEIVKYFSRKFGVNYSAEDEVLVGNGASEIFDIVVRSILNPGDEVILFMPSYVMYAPLVQLAAGVPIFVKQISEIQKKISPRTKAIILGYPSNPTGTTFQKSELQKIAKIAERNNLLVISDEIYAELTYEGRHTTFASLPKMKARTATVSGFSKTFAFTGLRLGYLLAPADLTAAANKIHQYSALCANSISQIAAIEALRNCDSEVEKMRLEYKMRRDFCVRELKKMGFQIQKPAGAFYLFLNVCKKTGLTGEEFALELLEKEEVAVVPGSAFGAEFSDFVRISFATSLQNLEIAFEKIEHFLKN
ncbi:aminotransferase class I/II-fold pyridoxal phosphate-dependent enzyme [Candidatus Gracilibacteria bacterium]|nr:aminotransferase class I/II-fold pyridoxal phosphate-dependent enzyme [Candidatus Gracilibacteria bacterium]MCF7856002.1 aminotransferase class I/II-fold pyridoxal phosphate-dependent enzyme [Candidatus Gracilibacteria bacterium]MCF7896305.1 aminotransferase class I/II-fold pyridoxal phosphate-dependent enzyme [Candidatus Gracilibacteria bacterium]